MQKRLLAHRASPAWVQTKLCRKRVIDPDTDCWLWQGWCESTGEGRVMVLKKRWKVHRLAAVAWLGFDDDPTVTVSQSCGRRSCFNPEHLYYGEPIADVVALWHQTRAQEHVRQGLPRIPLRVLKDADIPLLLDALQRRVPLGSIAARFGVSQHTLRMFRLYVEARQRAAPWAPDSIPAHYVESALIRTMAVPAPLLPL